MVILRWMLDISEKNWGNATKCWVIYMLHDIGTAEL